MNNTSKETFTARVFVFGAAGGVGSRLVHQVILP